MLNDYQQLAVDCDDSHIVCLAGAGTGKTFTLIERIKRLVTNKIDPRSILVLTFTNAAGAEMKQRYKKSYHSGFIPEFRTFHSFCYHLICTDENIRKLLGYSKVPTIINAASIKRIESTVRQQLHTTLSTAVLSGKVLPSNPKQQFEYDVYYKQFRKSLQQENAITFDILCYDVCRLFSENNPACDIYKKRYQYVFVDEFQDTDKLQWQFVQSFYQSNIFVVGDILQNIYSFRGSDSSIMKSLIDNDDWKCIRLPKNYRSTQQICDFANKMSSYIPSQYRLALSAVKSGEPVVIRDCIHPRYPNSVDIETTKNIIEQLKNFQGTTAILCRTNREVQQVVQELSDARMNTATSCKNNDCLNLLQSISNADYFIDWSASTFDAERYAEYIRLLTIEVTETMNPLDWFMETFATDQIRHNYECVQKAEMIIHSNLQPFQKIRNIADCIGIEIDLLDTTLDEDVDIIEFLTDFTEQSEDSAIYVGTIHSSKGLEYDNVILVNVDSKLFPLDSIENNNLYYVGITRARSNLIIYKC